MARLQAKVFDTEGDPHAFSNGLAQILKLGEATVARAVYEPGWRWTTDMREVTGNQTCQLHHLAYAISGELHVLTDEGRTLEVKPGSVYEIPPGHDAWVVGDEPVVVVDWYGATNYAKAS
jgi:quercetin dioxygenase-like cupin family protein